MDDAMDHQALDFDSDRRLRFAEITEETRAALRAFWPVLQKNLPTLLDAFYSHVAADPALAAMIGNRVPRLKEAQTTHWRRLFAGSFDRDYFDSVYRIGLAHQKIGLEPRWYIAGYNYVLSRIAELAIAKHRYSSRAARSTVRAVTKAVLFDMDVAVSAYYDLIERTRAAQTAATVASIGKVGEALYALAKGNLTYRLGEEMDGVFAKLREDFNAASGQLESAIKAVLSGAAGINTGASEIASAADDLSRRTEQQAASLEETAAALEQITATVKRTAENARKTDSIVSTAKRAAEEGGQIVESAIGAMSQIEQSSKKITDIIGVIDEIAFQTNLLALNAGVEAARAGDAGKGFAVVASEVRALAQRSGEAAKEIKALIKTSGSHVDSGVKLVGESGKALKAIVEQVVTINSLVNEMAEAAHQQSTGIEEVNVAVGQMDQVTQQNAAMVEESTAAARSLADETTALTRLVSIFTVEDHAGVEHSLAAPKHRTAASARFAPRPATAQRGGAALAVKPVASEDDWQEF
jgi:methyl-accepting chemotaxis protein